MADSNKKPVIVYGASGYTGRLVCEFLRQYAIPFVAAGRGDNHRFGKRIGVLTGDKDSGAAIAPPLPGKPHAAGGVRCGNRVYIGTRGLGDA